MIYVAYDSNNSDLIYYGDFSDLAELPKYMTDLYNKCIAERIDEPAIAIINLSDDVERLILDLLHSSSSYGYDSLVEFVDSFMKDYPNNHWIAYLGDFKDAKDFVKTASSWPDLDVTL